jgi:hypothetical protein
MTAESIQARPNGQSPSKKATWPPRCVTANMVCGFAITYDIEPFSDKFHTTLNAQLPMRNGTMPFRCVTANNVCGFAITCHIAPFLNNRIKEIMRAERRKNFPGSL